MDFGTDGGTAGAMVVFTGSTKEMFEHADTVTTKY